MRARFIDGMLAFWLFLSVFFWPHSRFQIESSMLVAVAAMCFVCMAITGARWARYAVAALGAWLIVAGIVELASTSSRLTPIHNLVVGLLLSCFGMMRDVGHWYADSDLEPGPNTVGFTSSDEITVRASRGRQR